MRPILYLTGYHASKNFGDMLMLESFLGHAQAEGFSCVHQVPELSGYSPSWKAYLQGQSSNNPPTLLQDRIFWLKRGGRRNHRLVLVGGTHVQEYDNGKSGTPNLVSRLQRISKRIMPIDLVGVGINPVSYETNILAAKALLNGSDWVSTRDLNSERIALTLCERPPFGGVDMAFASNLLLNYKLTNVISNRILISVVNPSDDSLRSKFYKNILELTKELHSANLYPVLFVAEKEWDLPVIEHIGHAFREIHISQGNLGQDIEFLSSCSYALSQRFHVLLCCAALGLRIIWSEYNPKVRSLAKLLEIDTNLDFADSMRLKHILELFAKPSSQAARETITKLRDRATLMLKSYFNYISRVK